MSATMPGRPTPSTRRRVLIVDDDDQILALLKDYLTQRLGDEFLVLAARDGLEGLEAIRLELPGLVILDVEMPGMSGLQLLQHIQAIDRGIPVIVLTGAADPRVPGQTLMQGAAAYAPKPLSFKYLDQLVAMFLALPDEMTERWSHLRS
jgi:DNA-binding NtrC family response regulator